MSFRPPWNTAESREACYDCNRRQAQDFLICRWVHFKTCVSAFCVISKTIIIQLKLSITLIVWRLLINNRRQVVIVLIVGCSLLLSRKKQTYQPILACVDSKCLQPTQICATSPSLIKNGLPSNSEYVITHLGKTRYSSVYVWHFQ